MACFMGIDAGTSGIKVIVLDGTGNILGESYRECELLTPKPNWAEQRPADWWAACREAVRQAARGSGRGKEIAAISFSGQMQGCTLMDKHMQPIDNCIIWLDQRAGAEAEELSASIDVSEMLKITGGFCLPTYWAAKLLWLKRNRPEVFDKIHTVLFAKDYLRYQMTGEVATEVSDASLTFLLDLNTRGWSERMLDICGLPKSIMPKRMLESQDIAGYLKADLAGEWGMTAGIPVIAGGGDQPVGGVGGGVVKSGVVAASIGTSGVVFGCCDAPFSDARRRGMYSLCHSVPGKYSFLGCTLGAGGSYKWMRDTLFAPLKDEFAAKGENVYSHMNSLAKSAPVGSEGLCFLPYLNGESTPHVDPDARGVFFGLSYRHGLGDMCRSVMEGVCFSLRDTIEILRESDVEISEVRALGGGSKSPLWRQIQADIFNAEVKALNVEEVPAAGAAILAAVGSGYFKSVEEACGALLRITGSLEPIPANVKIYDEYYQTYRQLYADLKNSFARQARIVEQHI